MSRGRRVVEYYQNSDGTFVEVPSSPTRTTFMTQVHKSEVTLGTHLCRWAGFVFAVAAVLFTVAFGIAGLIAAWEHLDWPAALAITIAAAAIVIGSVGYAIELSD